MTEQFLVGNLGLTQNLFCVLKIQSKPEVVRITGIFLGVIIGTAFVFDMFYSKIPNYVLITGYFILFPNMYLNNGMTGVWQAAIAVVLSGIILFTMYMVGALGAGDVKLICLICGFIGIKNGGIFILLTIFIGAGMGLVKMMLRVIDGISGKRRILGRTTIKFTLPVLTAYLIMLITKGGI